MIDMKDIDKILLFATFALIVLSLIYVASIKHESEIELDVSNALINDLILNKKYTDGTYASDWVWRYTEVNGTMTDTHYEHSYTSCFDISKSNQCTQHIMLSDQALNGTTHIRIKASINFLDVLSFVLELQSNKKISEQAIKSNLKVPVLP